MHRATVRSLVWQRNYYEHVIRNERALNPIRAYIMENLMRWSEDPKNPDGLRARHVSCIAKVEIGTEKLIYRVNVRLPEMVSASA